jgi:hypothetical protein
VEWVRHSANWETLFNLLYIFYEQTNFCCKVEKDHVTLMLWQLDSFIAPPSSHMLE